jgi:hypothetical protein
MSFKPWEFGTALLLFEVVSLAAAGMGLVAFMIFSFTQEC